MPKSSKRKTKPKKRSGRPRKYAKSKEKFTVYNKKRPVARLFPGEKEILEYLRNNPTELNRLKNMAKSPKDSGLNS